MTDLSVQFQAPSFDRASSEPTVGGLTGEQLSLLSVWDDENRCEAEIFPVSPKGPAERCLEPKEVGSKFCVDHFFADMPDEFYDGYDSHRDREFE